jgi:hypothetical protein
LLLARANLELARGQWSNATRTYRSIGERLRVHGWTNPAFLPWRSGAAIALLAQDEVTPARAMAEEELTFARRWRAPRVVGRALWVSGLVHTGRSRLLQLEEAIAVLAASPARLEHARALVELGSVLRRSGQRISSREPLR